MAPYDRDHLEEMELLCLRMLFDLRLERKRKGPHFEVVIDRQLAAIKEVLNSVREKIAEMDDKPA